jgi:hypothetical protein
MEEREKVGSRGKRGNGRAAEGKREFARSRERERICEEQREERG